MDQEGIIDCRASWRVVFGAIDVLEVEYGEIGCFQRKRNLNGREGKA